MLITKEFEFNGIKALGTGASEHEAEICAKAQMLNEDCTAMFPEAIKEWNSIYPQGGQNVWN